MLCAKSRRAIAHYKVTLAGGIHFFLGFLCPLRQRTYYSVRIGQMGCYYIGVKVVIFLYMLNYLSPLSIKIRTVTLSATNFITKVGDTDADFLDYNEIIVLAPFLLGVGADTSKADVATVREIPATASSNLPARLTNLTVPEFNDLNIQKQLLPPETIDRDFKSETKPTQPSPI